MQKRSKETKQRIIEAAREVFANSGFDGGGVSDICLEAGVSKGAFYHHFSTKQAVFLELLESWLDEIDQFLSRIKSESRTVPETLLSMTRALAFVFQSGEGQLPMLLEYWRRANQDPEIWRATVAPYRRFQQLFKELVQAGIDEGSFKPMDTDAAARTIVALAVGLILQGLMDPDGTDWERVAQKAMGQIIEGMVGGSS